MRFLIPDRFVQLLIATVVLASLLPLRGQAAVLASWVSNAAIFLLFFLHGVRLPRAEVIAGIRNWRLQGAIFGFVFGAMAAAGLALGHGFAPLLPADIATGLVFLGVLPSTVQSATAYCSIARGNVAASVVASAIVNLAGVVVAPLLFALLASASGVAVHGDAVVKILTILLLPFGLGQLLQARLRPWALRHPALTGWMDRGSIAIAVYVAFSGAVVAGIWGRVDAGGWGALAGALVLLLGFAFGGAWLVGGLLRLPPADRRALLFSGAQKSIAIGAPLAAILFPPDRAGLILLPVLAYHLAQLILSAPVAARLGRL